MKRMKRTNEQIISDSLRGADCVRAFRHRKKVYVRTSVMPKHHTLCFALTGSIEAVIESLRKLHDDAIAAGFTEIEVSQEYTYLDEAEYVVWGVRLATEQEIKQYEDVCKREIRRNQQAKSDHYNYITQEAIRLGVSCPKK